MAWLTGWDNRKKITIDSTHVAGSGTLSNFPIPVKLLGDPDIAAGADATGKDIRFTSDDGSTVLDYELIPRGEIFARDGAWTWFNDPRVVYNAESGDHCFYGSVFSTDLDNEIRVYKWNATTGEVTWGRFDSISTLLDDHNNAALVRRSDGKWLIMYTGHSESHDIAYRVSTSADDITAWGSESTITGYNETTYVNVFRLTGEGTGSGRIYCFSRDKPGDRNWVYSYTDNDGTSWTGPTNFWTDNSTTTFPYVRMASNGTDRVDFLATTDHPNATNQDVVHFYYDGTWRESDGTTLGTLPSSGFDTADLGTSSTIFDGSAGSDTAWINDITYDSSSRPRALWTKYIADSTTAAEYWYSTFSGTAWTSAKITDAPRLISASVEPYYTAGGCIDPDNDRFVYIGIDVTSNPEIQYWVKDGTWAKDSDITTASGKKQFRPYCVQNHPGGSVGGKVFWCAGGIYDDFVHTTVRKFSIGIRAYPAIVSQFALAYVEVPSLSATTDTDIYVYYGNTGASDAQDPAGTWGSYARVWHFDDNANSDVDVYPESVSGGVTFGDMANVLEHEEVAGTQFDESLPTIGTTVATKNANRLDTNQSVSMASLSGITLDGITQYDSSRTNEHNLFSNWVGTGGPGVLLRLEPNSPADSVEFFVITGTGTQQGGGTSAGAVTAGAAEYIAGVFDGTAVKVRVGTTETSVATFGSTTMRTSGAVDDLVLGAGSATQGTTTDLLQGSMAAVRIAYDAKDKDWTDTVYKSYFTSGFTTTGAEETPAAGIAPIAFHHRQSMRRR